MSEQLTSDKRLKTKYGAQFAHVVAQGASFKALTPNQREPYFGQNERCNTHGDFRCLACSKQAAQEPR